MCRGAFLFLFLPAKLRVSKTASGESGQNDGGLVRGKGIGTFAEVVGKRNRAKDSSPWFCPICRAKAMCGKEAFLLT